MCTCACVCGRAIKKKKGMPMDHLKTFKNYLVTKAVMVSGVRRNSRGTFDFIQEQPIVVDINKKKQQQLAENAIDFATTSSTSNTSSILLVESRRVSNAPVEFDEKLTTAATTTSTRPLNLSSSSPLEQHAPHARPHAQHQRNSLTGQSESVRRPLFIRSRLNQSLVYKFAGNSSNSNSSDVVSFHTAPFKQSSSSQRSSSGSGNRHLTNKQLLEANRLSSAALFDWLHADVDDLMRYFNKVLHNSEQQQQQQQQPATDDAQTPAQRCLDASDIDIHVFLQMLDSVKLLLVKCTALYSLIERDAHVYDYEPGLKSNGHRSLLRAFEACCRRLVKAVRGLCAHKKSLSFYFKLQAASLPVTGNQGLKDVQTYAKLLANFEILLKTSYEMQRLTLPDETTSGDNAPPLTTTTLFVNADQLSNSFIEDNLFTLSRFYLLFNSTWLHIKISESVIEITQYE